MGIKTLSSFIQHNCKKAYKEISISELSGKTIAIDVLIYIYLFKGNNILYENMFKMCNIFIKYNITPIFIFDGDTPEEKKKEVEKRYIRKNKEEKKIKEIKKLMNSEEITLLEKEKLEKELIDLKKSSTRLNKIVIQDIKTIIKSCGMNYVVAPYEAETLCVYWTKIGKVYATMSNDSDLFAYGCPRILKYIHLNSETITIYNFNMVLDCLNISYELFSILCIMSGGDYNCNNKTFDEIYNDRKNIEYNSNYENNKIYNENIKKLDNEYYKNYKIEKTNSYIINDIKNVLEKEGFIFI